MLSAAPAVTAQCKQTMMTTVVAADADADAFAVVAVVAAGRWRAVQHNCTCYISASHLKLWTCSKVPAVQ